MIERFTPKELQGLRKMDHCISQFKVLQNATMITGKQFDAMVDLNEEAFQEFYNATRTLTINEDFTLNIAVNQDMVSVASGRLLQHGYPQYLKHEVVEDIDKLIGGKQYNKDTLKKNTIMDKKTLITDIDKLLKDLGEYYGKLPADLYNTVYDVKDYILQTDKKEVK